MVLGKLASHMQKIETGPLPYNLYKINSRRIKDLNVKPKAIKTLKEKLLQATYHFQELYGIDGYLPSALSSNPSALPGISRTKNFQDGDLTRLMSAKVHTHCTIVLCNVPDTVYIT